MVKLKLHEIELFMNDANETKKFYSETLSFKNLMDEDGIKVWDSGLTIEEG
jgi:catechol 2,3-dioxygenase-like lactoylglutathione lyase family enzyme